MIGSSSKCMKNLTLFFIVICLNISCRAENLIEKSWFDGVDGKFVKAEYIDLNKNNTERLYLRYCPLTDSGVELEKVTNNVVIWRVHVQPIIPLEQQNHSKYCHEIKFFRVEDQITVIRAAGFSVGKMGDAIFAEGKDAKQVFEVRSLKTGELISRNIYGFVKSQ